jgi:hypothetical protein
MSQNCFVENTILWKRINRHGSHHTMVVTPQALTEMLLIEVHINVLFGHEGQNKPRKD